MKQPANERERKRERERERERGDVTGWERAGWLEQTKSTGHPKDTPTMSHRHIKTHRHTHTYKCVPTYMDTWSNVGKYF